MKLFLLSFVGALLFSCGGAFTEGEVLGIYVPVDYKNCFDTLQLKKYGIYHRSVYDSGQRKLLDMEGRWILRDDGRKIMFHSYYHNLDDNLLKFPHLVKDTAGGGEFILERDNNTIKFSVGHFSADLPNQNCYQKLKQ